MAQTTLSGMAQEQREDLAVVNRLRDEVRRWRESGDRGTPTWADPGIGGADPGFATFIRGKPPGAYAMLGLILLGASAGVAFVGWRLHKHFYGRPPWWVSVPFFFATSFGLGPLAILFVLGSGITLATGPIWMGIVVIIVAFPCFAAGSLVAASLTDVLHALLFDPGVVDPDSMDFGRAKTCAVRGDYEGAMQAYRAYFEQNPKRPTALFAAALYAEQQKDYSRAASFYREIMRRFEKSRPVWAEAALSLSEIADRHLDDPKTAESLLRDVLRHARNFKQARVAAARVMRRYSTTDV